MSLEVKGHWGLLLPPGLFQPRSELKLVTDNLPLQLDFIACSSAISSFHYGWGYRAAARGWGYRAAARGWGSPTLDRHRQRKTLEIVRVLDCYHAAARGWGSSTLDRHRRWKTLEIGRAHDCNRTAARGWSSSTIWASMAAGMVAPFTMGLHGSWYGGTFHCGPPWQLVSHT